MKSIWLDADQQASHILGKRVVIHTLEKVYAVADDQDFLTCKGLRGWFRSTPGLPQRIDRLMSEEV